jgi:hypothetical protein
MGMVTFSEFRVLSIDLSVALPLARSEHIVP